MADKKNNKQVLMISKPLIPPWDDSAKNVVRSQVTRGQKYRYRVLTAKTLPHGLEEDAASLFPDGVVAHPVYTVRGKYRPSFAQNMRVLTYGLLPRGASVYHYFFAPNPLTSMAGRTLQIVNRVKTVQTVCSRPASFDNISRLLFSDMVVVLSNETRNRMIDAGVDGARIRMVRPCIEPIERPNSETRRHIRRDVGLPEEGPVVVFPGDYEFSTASETVARAVPLLYKAIKDITVVFACRIKTATSKTIRNRIRDELKQAGTLHCVKFVESVPDMPSFLGSADVVVMPSESLYAKMDAPLVLLEAMSQQVPLVLADVPPLNELLEFGAGLGVPPGDPQALAAATRRVLETRALGEELGEKGRRAVGDVFSAKTMTESIEMIYDEVLRR
jgi:glycosyltransferase involved in cell wall biosynthesis